VKNHNEHFQAALPAGAAIDSVVSKYGTAGQAIGEVLAKTRWVATAFLTTTWQVS